MSSRRMRAAEEIELEIDRTRSDIDQTLAALRGKFAPGQVVEQAFGYAKGGGADFAANIGKAVRDNPIPATLLGIGLGWLMVSGARSGEARGVGHSGRGSAAFPRDPHLGHDTSEEGRSGVSVGRSARRAREGAGAAVETAQSKVEALQETAADRAQRAAGMASTAARGLRERTSQWRTEGRQRLRGTRDRARSLVGETREAGHRVTAQTRTMAHDHPLLTGALGLAVGAAIAAALPVTRREREAMGWKSDEAKKAAQDVLREGIEQAKGVAGAAYEGAVDEAKRRGLAPDSPQAGADPGKREGAASEREVHEAATPGAPGIGSPGGSPFVPGRRSG